MVTAIEERMYTVAQVADLLYLHVNTVRRMIRRGQLGHYKDGRYLRISESDLNAHLDGIHREPKPDSVAPRSRRPRR